MPILSRKTINLLILGESGDVLEALTRVPELAEKYVGKVKLIYIDPPFNTAQTFASYEDNLDTLGVAHYDARSAAAHEEVAEFWWFDMGTSRLR